VPPIAARHDHALAPTVVLGVTDEMKIAHKEIFGPISVVRAIIRSQGYRIAGGATGTFLARLAAVALPVSVSESLMPVRSVMELLNHELADADHRVEALVAEDPIVKRLTSCSSVGPITATAFVAALPQRASVCWPTRCRPGDELSRSRASRVRDWLHVNAVTQKAPLLRRIASCAGAEARRQHRARIKG
jgi:hypothetical protein